MSIVGELHHTMCFELIEPGRVHVIARKCYDTDCPFDLDWLGHVTGASFAPNLPRNPYCGETVIPQERLVPFLAGLAHEPETEEELSHGVELRNWQLVVPPDLSHQVDGALEELIAA